MTTGEQLAAAAGAIVVEDVHKSFGANEVLSGISLAVAAHEVICLIGASGSGKSTLLRCINLLEPIDSGRISLLGQQVTGPGIDANRVRRAVGIVFQSYNLFPHMTVLRNVTLAPIKALGMTKAAGDRARRGTSWPGSGSRTSRPSTRTACPAGSSSEWPSSGRWQCSRRSCFWTR